MTTAPTTRWWRPWTKASGSWSHAWPRMPSTCSWSGAGRRWAHGARVLNSIIPPDKFLFCFVSDRNLTTALASPSCCTSWPPSPDWDHSGWLFWLQNKTYIFYLSSCYHLKQKLVWVFWFERAWNHHRTLHFIECLCTDPVECWHFRYSAHLTNVMFCFLL